MNAAKCTTQWHVLTAYLWQQKTWLPTHSLQGVKTDYGFIGSSGEQRVRELAVNAPCVPAILRDKVEKRRGSEIGLDPRYEFFRFKQKPTRADYEAHAAELCRRFDAGLSASEVFAV